MPRTTGAASAALKKYHISVFGCTGNAGRVCGLFAIKFAGENGVVALAGRNEAKLTALRASVLSELGLPGDGSKGGPVVDILVADAADPSSMLAMAKASQVVLACAGPYGRYGESAVSACIDGGAHYVDITGETPWVAKMMNKYGKAAEAAKVSLLSFAGYDCIPAELALQLCARALGPEALGELDMVFSSKGGGFPKGTLNTILDGIEGKGRFRREKGDEPLVPREYKGVQQRALAGLNWILPAWVARANVYTAQNFMATVNAPVLARAASHMGVSNALKIRDRLSVGGKRSASPATLWGLVPVVMFQCTLFFGGLLLCLPPFRWWLKRRLESYSYDGASKGKTRMDARGTSLDQKSSVDVSMACAGDPGIYATGRFAASVAWALVDASSGETPVRAGFASPFVAFLGNERALLKRLQDGGVDITVNKRIDGVVQPPSPLLVSSSFKSKI